MQVECSICGRRLQRGEFGRVVDAQPACRECADEARPSCPNCGADLPKKPGRKTRCKSCSQHMYIRSSQGLYPTTIVTEDQAFEVDWSYRLEGIGLSKDDYTEIRRSLEASEMPFGPKDYVWAAINRAVLTNPEEAEYTKAQFLAETGKDPTKNLIQARRYALEEWKARGSDRVTINSLSCCTECRGMHGVSVRIEDALATPLLPQTNCTHRLSDESKFPFCTCYFSPEWED